MMKIWIKRVVILNMLYRIAFFFSFWTVERFTVVFLNRLKVTVLAHWPWLYLSSYTFETWALLTFRFCGSNQIEDEIPHFLFNGSEYSLIRNNFYNKVTILIPNIIPWPIYLINELMNTSYYFIYTTTWEISAIWLA